MGSGMSKVLPGLYVGNFRDAKDTKQLTDNNITHILAIHDNAKKLHEDKEYLCIVASDNSEQELTEYFPGCIEFIHNARLNKGNVLVHCLAGVSRSVTVTAAYLMTVTELSWRDALNSIRGVRNGANPNFGFQKQLQKYQNEGVTEARRKLKQNYPETNYNDHMECLLNLEAFKKFVLYGSPTKDDGLYPLPYNAYKRDNSNKAEEDASEKAENCVPNASHDETGRGGNSHYGKSVRENKSGENLCSDESDTKPNNDCTDQEFSTNNRNKTVDFESLSDDIDEVYSNFSSKKVQ